MKNFTAEQKQNIIIIGFAALLLIHLIFVFAGFYNNDDINYAKYAAGIVNNGISFKPATSHYQLRWTVIFITALFYKVFGINNFSSALCSFISLIISAFILKKIVRNYNTSTYFLSLLFFFFAHSIIFYSHRLLPDPAMCLFAIWMYVSYRSYYLKQINHISYALQFSVAFLLAVITKETIIIILPLFIIFFIKDVLKKERLQFWFIAISAAAALVILYLTYFKITAGSFFYRYQLLQAGSYFSGCSFDVLPFIYTLKRIGYELWLALLLNGDLLIFIPAFVAFIYRKKLTAYANITYIDYWAFLILLCSANFMTISFLGYVPLCPDPRHFLFLFPFAAIVAGPLLFAYFKNPGQFLLLPVSLIIATLILFFLSAGNTKYIYLLFSLLLITKLFFSFASHYKMNDKVFIALFASIFLINYLIDFIKPPYPYYWDHKKITEQFFAGKNVTAKIFSADELSGKITAYFLQFKTGNLQILPMDSVKTSTPGNLYYLLVADLNPAAQTKIDSLINRNNDTGFFLVRKENNVSLYKVDNAILQQLK